MKIETPKDNFSNLTTEDLIKKKKSTTFSTGLLGGVLIALLVITLLTMNKGATALLAIPFALLPILIKSYNQVKSMDKELKNRNLN